MSNVNFTPARTGFSRVFLVDGGARIDHQPAYQLCLRAGSASRSFGDITSIEIPSPNRYDDFITVGVIRNADERPTISLVGRYAADIKSELLRLANKGCAVDVHVVIGACDDPQDDTTFSKKIVVEDAFITNWDVDELGALSSEDRAAIDETAEVSGSNLYEITTLQWAERAGDVVTNEVLDVIIGDDLSCGDECDEISDGCQRIYATTLQAGGSPGTPADVVFSLNGGGTFYAHDIDTLASNEDPDGLARLGNYLVVVSEDSGSLHYAPIADITPTTDPVFSEVSTGFEVGGEPRAISSSGRKAFIVGAGGYIYALRDVASGPTVLDAGTATSENLNAVHALSDDLGLAGGQNGAIAFTVNGTIWSAPTTSPVGAGVHINDVLMRSPRYWIVVTSNGRMYYTVDGGSNWTEKGFFGSGSGSVESISAASDTVMYIAHTPTAGSGRILRSTNGGADWVVMPESSGNLPANDRINSLAACQHDPDFVVGVGLADDGTDGIILLGTS
jgi:photosystem II stability/assembly factor-like uncharacterized protein